ncbi:tRNA pseudouridine38-40 synthase [Marinococcus luteus]|uniref:tRNA pseudouridine synthase A n=1 Tax=Marinococcus luteus TaxID=1122204 RepID=A0A1H2Y0G2_9BACI|nr:tRNA pseudouridine(38-40) synthase TruA [Marinococcus luteus]SDW98288.1 tRNA pseudouridine38-40 synthase [Marinococcus luteus]
MPRVKATVAYDGTFFEGWQVQPGRRTVQREIEEALQKMHKGVHVPIHASGRTDSGVHAKGQVFHFDSPLQLPEHKWGKALESFLPKDIHVWQSAYADEDFHARFDAVEKEYRYCVLLRKERDVFRRNHAFYYPYPTDVEAVQKAVRYIEGEHDFSSFCAANTDVKEKTRTVYKADATLDGEELWFTFRGSGFLYNMIRIAVGTLLEIGKGNRSPEEMKAIIEAKERAAAGNTAPGHGLYLWKVNY